MSETLHNQPDPATNPRFEMSGAWTDALKTPYLEEKSIQVRIRGQQRYIEAPPKSHGFLVNWLTPKGVLISRKSDLDIVVANSMIVLPPNNLELTHPDTPIRHQNESDESYRRRINDQTNELTRYLNQKGWSLITGYSSQMDHGSVNGTDGIQKEGSIPIRPFGSFWTCNYTKESIYRSNNRMELPLDIYPVDFPQLLQQKIKELPLGSTEFYEYQKQFDVMFMKGQGDIDIWLDETKMRWQYMEFPGIDLNGTKGTWLVRLTQNGIETYLRRRFDANLEIITRKLTLNLNDRQLTNQLYGKNHWHIQKLALAVEIVMANNMWGHRPNIEKPTPRQIWDSVYQRITTTPVDNYFNLIQKL